MQRKIILLLLALITAVGSGMTAHANPIDVPTEVVEISEELGDWYDICPELIQAICFKESSFQSDAENGGCVGIMQVAPKWHRDRMCRLGAADLFDVKQNMLVGTDYLSELILEYEDVSVALMIYNGDSSAEDVLNGSADVSAYADEILSISAELERENGK